MILPVETKQSKRQQSEDKNLNLIHLKKGKIMLDAFVEIQLVVTAIAVVAAFTHYVFETSAN